MAAPPGLVMCVHRSYKRIVRCAVDRRTTLLHLFELVAGSDGQRSLRLQEPPFTQLGVGGAIVTVQVVNIAESVVTWGVPVVKRPICNSAIFAVKNGRFPISVQYPAISQLQARLRNGRAFIVGSTIISSRKSPLTDMFRMPKAALETSPHLQGESVQRGYCRCQRLNRVNL